MDMAVSVLAGVMLALHARARERRFVAGRAIGARGRAQSGGSARLKRLAGRNRIQVNRLDDAVASQNMKKPML